MTKFFNLNPFEMVGLPRQTRQVLNAAFVERSQPQLQGNVLYVRSSRGRVNIEAGGKGLSAAGKAYHASARNAQGDRLKWRPRTVAREPDIERAVERTTKDGLRKFIQGPDGKRRLTMDWDAIGLKMVPTKLGRRFYRESKMTVSVIAPLVAEVKQQDGGTRTYEPEMAWDRVTDSREEVQLLRRLDEAGRQAELRRRLIQEGDWDGDHLYLQWLEDSELAFRWNNQKPFPIKELEILASSVNIRDLPAQSAHVLKHAYFRAFHGIAPEAYQGAGGQCVAYQISEIEGLPRATVDDLIQQSWEGRYGVKSALPEEQNPYIDDFTLQLSSWESRGVSGQSVIDVARRPHVTCRVYDVSGQTLLSHTPDVTDHHLRPLMVTVHSGHAFFYSEESVLRSLAHAGGGGGNASRVELKDVDVAPRVREWAEFPHDPLVVERGKRYFHPHVQLLRNELIKAGTAPGVRMKGIHDYKALSYNGASVVAEPDMAPELEAFAKLAGVPWEGQSLGGMMAESFRRQIQPRRQRIPAAVRREVEERQGGECAICGEPSSELDHCIPVCAGGGNTADNLRALCSVCHAEHTQQQQQGGSTLRSEFLPGCSHFNEAAHRVLVEENKPRAFAHKLREPGRKGALVFGDQIRARYTALTMALNDDGTSYEWPVFSVLDDIDVVDGPTALRPGYWFVNIETPAPNPPCRGRAWYTSNVLKFMLACGQCTWGDVSHKIVATGSLPGLYFQRHVDQITEWCDRVGLPQKKAINALCGCLSTSRRWKYRLHVSTCKAELAHLCPRGYVSWTSTGATPLCEVVEATEMRSLATYRPLADYILGCEAVFLACLQEFAMEIPSCVPLEMSTDGALFWCHTRDRKKLEDAITEHRYVCKLKDPEQSRLRCEPAWKPGTESFELPPRVWATITEEAQVDIFPRSLDAVLGGGGCQLTGPPGTGKSHMIRRLKEALDERGIRHTSVAPTHAACKQIGGQTLHRFCHRMFRRGDVPKLGGVLICDEIGFVGAALLTLLAEVKLSNPDLVFVVCGDWNQLPPICDTWGLGAPITRAQREHSGLIHQLAAGNHCRLTQCRRSDQALFNVYTNLPSLEALKHLFPFRGLGRWNLCISHKTRKHLITRANRRCRLLPHLVIEADRRFPNSQKLYLAVDEPLICCKTIILKGQVVCPNNSLWTVASLSPLNLIDSEGWTLQDVNPEVVPEYFRSAHATIYISAQGLTLPGTVCLWETRSRHCTPSHLLVGISRATAYDLASVAPLKCRPCRSGPSKNGSPSLDRLPS